MATVRRLDGARVVVTGAARGIGAGIARRFAADGARVAVLDVLEDRGRVTAAEVGGSFHAVDLADPSASALLDAVAADGMDVLVNAAGILLLGPLLETTPEQWDRVQAVNARAMLVTMQAAARAMIPAGGGRIVNPHRLGRHVASRRAGTGRRGPIASMAARTGGAGEAAYAASKAAVLALTRAAALEWGVHGIAVNAVCPGYVPTEMGAATRTDADVAAWSARSPLGRLATVDDVAAAVHFLASPDAGYLTGVALDVTGGMTTC